MSLPAGLSPRFVAAGAIALLLVALVAVSWRASPRCRRPGVLWGVTTYYACLLGVFLYGLVSSLRFETAFGHLTMLTFPFSIATDHTSYEQGFATLHEIARHFLRYCLVYGGLDGLILSGFLFLVVPKRRQITG